MFQAVNLKRAEAAGSDHTLDLFVGILRNERHLPAFPKERYSAFIVLWGKGLTHMWTSGKPVGLLVREDLLSALKDHDPEASITTFMRAPVETVRRTARLRPCLTDFMGRKLRLWLLPIPRGSSSAYSRARTLPR